MLFKMTQSELFKVIRTNLQPEKPIRTIEFLRGRDKEYKKTVRELEHFDGIPFVFGHRGVGKTSLARTAAQIATKSDREHIYVACAPESRMLQIFREVGEQMLRLLIEFGVNTSRDVKWELKLSVNPHIKASIENSVPKLPDFNDPNEAVRTLKLLDDVLPDARQTVIVIDELEELTSEDRNALAFLIKQIGDQDFSVRFLLVGIAENVHELIGAHESVPRYLTEVPLQPLSPQNLMDIISDAAANLNIQVDQEILYRVAIIGNGFPYYAHLIGKALLIEAIEESTDEITPEIYAAAIRAAISESLQELRFSYDAATQRGEDYFKYMIWALADFDLVDIRQDDWYEHYIKISIQAKNEPISQARFVTASNNLRSEGFGNIISMTPAKYGATETRYRFRRFSNPLMKGFIRLQAENDNFSLGENPPL